MDTKSITWTVGDGRKAAIEITLRGRLDLQGRQIPGTYEVAVIGTLAGAVVGYSVGPDAERSTKIPSAVAWCGKLGLKADIYAAYLAGRAEIESDPRLAAYREQTAKRDAEMAALDSSRAALRRAMLAGERE